MWIFKIIKFNALNLFENKTNTDASILFYKFRPERTGFNIYATVINFPCIITLKEGINFSKSMSFLNGPNQDNSERST